MSEVGTVKVTLKTPITHNNVTYSELTFREAEIGDMMAADHFKTEFSGTIAVLASISGVPLPAFQKIKVSDMKNIIAQTAEQMGNEQNTQVTGTT